MCYIYISLLYALYMLLAKQQFLRFCPLEGKNSVERHLQFLAATVLLSKAKLHSQEGMREGCVKTRNSPAVRAGLGFLEWWPSLPVFYVIRLTS